MSNSERSDLREVKDYLVETITDEQKRQGMPLPRPDLAKAFIEREQIIETTERGNPVNKHVDHSAPVVNEHTPDIERNILGNEEALARVRAKYGPNADVRMWLYSVRARDPQFAAEFDALFDSELTFTAVMVNGKPVPMFTPLGRAKHIALIQSAIDKYGDPRDPKKRIQVG